jgi:NADH-quinone oxidoreductase subunit D
MGLPPDVRREAQDASLAAPKAQHTQGSGEAEEQTGKARHTQEMLLNLGPQHPNVQIRQEGDCYARNAVRFQKIRESMRLCRVAIDQLPAGSISARTPIALRPPRGETYFALESSKGELGVYLISDGSEYPWRAKLRGPSFVNLQVLPELLRGYKMSDVIAVLGSLDFVVGEVDR